MAISVNIRNFIYYSKIIPFPLIGLSCTHTFSTYMLKDLSGPNIFAHYNTSPGASLRIPNTYIYVLVGMHKPKPKLYWPYFGHVK